MSLHSPTLLRARLRSGCGFAGSLISLAASEWTAKREGLKRLFSTHPPIEERIAALRNSA
jgi:Zn-dependent protease with chaperone function